MCNQLCSVSLKVLSTIKRPRFGWKQITVNLKEMEPNETDWTSLRLGQGQVTCSCLL
jgi:hypothetical protein